MFTQLKKLAVLALALPIYIHSAYAGVIELPDGSRVTVSDSLSPAAQEDIVNSFNNVKSAFARSASERINALADDAIAYNTNGTANTVEEAFTKNFTFRERTFTNRVANSTRAISDYTGQFTQINSYARTGTAVAPGGAEATSFNTRTIDRLDRGLEKLPKNEGASYRATQDYGIGSKLESGELGTGDVVADAAYQSTSSNLNFTASPSSEQFFGNTDRAVLYELRGRNGATLPFKSGFSQASNQFEVVYPRNTGFEIEGHSTFTAVLDGKEKTVTYIRASEVEASGSAEVLEDAVASHSGAPFVRNADGRFVPGCR